VTKGEAQAFKQRAGAVNAAEREELRSTTVADKFRQVAALLASARKLGWTEALAAGRTWSGSAGPGCAGSIMPKPPDLTPLLAVLRDPVTWLRHRLSKYMADVYLDICFTKAAHHD